MLEKGTRLSSIVTNIAKQIKDWCKSEGRVTALRGEKPFGKSVATSKEHVSDSSKVLDR